jgi:acetyl-CoA synthetase
MFTAFGAKAIEQRLDASAARLLVTDGTQRHKLNEVRTAIPIATVGGAAESGDLDVAAAMAAASTQFEPVPLRGDDPFLMMFTSGTTGPPKRLLVPLRALLGFMVYMRDSVGLRSDDVFWNMADPGWAYGLYYGVAGPLLLGQTTLLCEAPFSVEGFYEKVGRLGVTNLIGAPTGYRMIKAAGPELAAQLRNRLRVVSSAGEPLNPEVARWFEEHLHVIVADHYGQTEGAMMVCNHHALTHEFRPASAGRPLPGFRMAILDADDRELPPGAHGVLAVDRDGSPLFWFTGYLGLERPGRYHRTGDMAFVTEDGYFSLIGRADDVITSAGYRIGPYDVESTLIEHPAVREAAVIGKPDAERTEIVKAFVVVDPKRLEDAGLKAELAQFVRRRLSAHAYPREIEFVAELPKTSSGKIQRFLLRQRESK